MGIILTLPISSAALSIILGLSGIAAGASTVGCAAQMVGFAAAPDLAVFHFHKVPHMNAFA